MMAGNWACRGSLCVAQVLESVLGYDRQCTAVLHVADIMCIACERQAINKDQAIHLNASSHAKSRVRAAVQA